MATLFEYTQSDFPQGFHLRRFARQFGDNAELGALEYRMRYRVNGTNFRVRVLFMNDLTAPQETALASVVAAHDPTAPLPPGRTVAQLVAMQPGQDPGRTAWARDGRKAGEPAGFGSGVLAYSDGTSWRSTDGGALEA